MPWRPPFVYENLMADLWPEGEALDTLVAAIVDPIQWPGLRDELSRSSVDWLLVDTGWNSATHADVLPYIIRLRPDCCVSRQILQAVGREIGIFLRAKGNPEQLMSVLAKYYALVPSMLLPEGDPTFLRYYDPHVFRAYFPVATESQKSFLFGEYIQNFWAENIVTGQLERFPRPDDLPPPCEAPPRLSPGQLEALLEAQYQKFIEALQDHVLDSFTPVPDEKTIKKIVYEIDLAVAAAEHYDFVSRREITWFVDCMVKFGFDFYENETIAKILAQREIALGDRMQMVTSYLGRGQQEPSAGA